METKFQIVYYDPCCDERMAPEECFYEHEFVEFLENLPDETIILELIKFIDDKPVLLFSKLNTDKCIRPTTILQYLGYEPIINTSFFKYSEL